MEKVKENGKDKYRKKAYTPLFKNPFDKQLETFEKEYKRISEDSPGELYKFLQNSFASNPNLEFAHYAPKTIKKAFIELASKGANLKIISDALFLYLDYSTNKPEFKPLFSPAYNLWLKSVNKTEKHFVNIKKAIRAAQKLLCSPLLAVQMGLKEDFISVQDELNKVLNKYLDLLPSRVSKRKFPTQKSEIWNKSIISLVDELKRIGLSHKQAYTKTGELLNFVHPDFYKDKDPDLIRQRYSYHSKK